MIGAAWQDIGWQGKETLITASLVEQKNLTFVSQHIQPRKPNNPCKPLKPSQASDYDHDGMFVVRYLIFPHVFWHWYRLLDRLFPGAAVKNVVSCVLCFAKDLFLDKMPLKRLSKEIPFRKG